MPTPYLEQVRKKDQQVNPLFLSHGIEVESIAVDRAVLRLEVTSGLIQGGGVVAGGIVASLLDGAMAHAVLGGNKQGEVASTIDMNVCFYHPVLNGECITCEGWVDKRGSRIVFAGAVALVEGREVAKATASFMIVH
ncbi:PaaI family thioesterase [Pseudodesulfovibrio piezophilus]|uniref:Thioesterase superfamily protein n=1 Tax=Pseudodesulfovibrio piezophilus (strain DSM 21447 / JCM 15486 / C1TLV30) TaxID=1322246 RepID=M1WRI8_PSEP2|nr:PaaI family thioesterase [Pseudodesulfovibrio piezophilus]CCH49579.1 Thioesterase superfamily protein [Pseudodesulfovibrio piezophilus C1TLV30]